MRVDFCCHSSRKAIAIHSQGATCWHLMRVGAGHDQRVHHPHFAMKHADSIAIGIIGAKRIGTNQFSEIRGFMRLGSAHTAHFMQDDRNAALGNLPGSF